MRAKQVSRKITQDQNRADWKEAFLIDHDHIFVLVKKKVRGWTRFCLFTKSYNVTGDNVFFLKPFLL